jgi:nucleoside-diphosphate-sugar epimerase
MNKPASHVVIIGCGYIGRQLAEKYRQDQIAVTGVVRSAESAESLQKLGIESRVIDLSSPVETDINFQDSLLFHFAPPPSSGTSDTNTRHLLQAFTGSGQMPQRIVYISTTGVYGNCEGRWIDENEPLKPDADRAKRRHDAEQQLIAFGKNRGVDIVILRVAGIYGPGKLPIKRLQQNLPVIRQEEAPYTNRIHAYDLVNIARQAMRIGKAGEIYNVSDGHPSTMTEYFNTVADNAGLPRPPQISLAEGERQLSAGMMSYMRESRRLKNEKLLNQLNLELLFPSLTSGIKNCGL